MLFYLIGRRKSGMKSLENNIAQQVFALNVSKLIDYIFASGYSCVLGEAFRTQEQAEWYEEIGKGINNSRHCKRMAIDLIVSSPSGKHLLSVNDTAGFGSYWEDLNPANKWGGNFQRGEVTHFEMRDNP